VRDELAYLATKAFTPSAVRDKPLIRSGRIAEKAKVLAPRGINDKDPTTQEAPPEDKQGDGSGISCVWGCGGAVLSLSIDVGNNSKTK
jgi:hypothetical protein